MPRIKDTNNHVADLFGASRGLSMKHLPKDLLTIGRGADYVIRTDEAVTLLSGGKAMEITTVTKSKSDSVLVIREPSNDQSQDRDDGVVLFAGSAAQTMQAYLEIGDLLTKPRRRSILDIAHKLASTVAAVAVIAALSAFFIETRQIASSMETPAPSAAAEQNLQLPTIPHPGDGLAAEADGLKVLKRPDFLDTSKPVANPVAEPPSAIAPESDVPAREQGKVPLLNLPPFDPSMYLQTAPTGQVQEGKASSDEKTDKQTDDKVSATDKEKTDPPAQAAASTTPEAPKSAAVDHATKNTVADDEVPDHQAKMDDLAIKKNAEAAIHKLIGDGMTQDQVRKLLMDLQQMNVGGGDEITPEMLQSLPEEVASLLADQGMDLQGQGSGTMNILPSEAVDAFRGKDGIATIPENYSWYARSGGPISIPLPGGGDIKKPEDLTDFGFQP